MRLQCKRSPDAMDGGGRHARRLGQRAHAPVGRIGGGRFQCAHDYSLNLLVANAPGSSGARFIKQAVHPPLNKPTPPFAYCLGRHAQPLGHRRVGQSLRTFQYDPRPQCERLRRVAALRPRFEPLSLARCHYQPCFWPSPLHTPPPS